MKRLITTISVTLLLFSMMPSVGAASIKDSCTGNKSVEKKYIHNNEQPVKEEPAEDSTSDENQAEAKEAENTPTEDTTSQLSEFEQEVAELTNQERAKHGLAPLTINVELSSVARAKSQDMIDKNYFDHQSPTYGSPFDMMKNFGISYSAAGENIAMGQKTPAQVVTGWMNSEGHRANILSTNYDQIGVGYAVDSNGTPYWTQMFIK